MEGTCIKHHLGRAQVKMHDKFALVLRIETTVNDASLFKHHRKVEHRDGPSPRELAPLKKSIYSLIDLREVLLGCNRRYLEFLSALDDHSAGLRGLGRLAEEERRGDRPIKGLNFFERTERQMLRALSRQLRRLRAIGLIKRVTGTYRYYLTRLGSAGPPSPPSARSPICAPSRHWPPQGSEIFAISVMSEVVWNY